MEVDSRDGLPRGRAPPSDRALNWATRPACILGGAMAEDVMCEERVWSLMSDIRTSFPFDLQDSCQEMWLVRGVAVAARCCCCCCFPPLG